ncbi:hypothetical protein CERSUDRAFT_82725 [Gelatoporia subvermispora B]|uniref:Small ribosomal subunit protein mS38 n=1 Tax=Ceriporiopsis subvermispora (strain B) TaxID=914234 RepID=M2QN71_CERS8|nr:hypothetical protein CERSUDRAFT_82725 [Gelatoporia subvermispora B]
MSVLTHLLRPIPAARRTYSVFSKPGGGRYFNSAKPPKVAPSNSPNSKVDASSTPSDPSTPSTTKDHSSPQSSAAPLTSDGPSHHVVPAPSPAPILVHPTINPQDLKLHLFFSQHRPLLLLSQPPSTAFESAFGSLATGPFNATSETPGISELDQLPMASVEEDADAARQLTRALVINKVEASMAWEDALHRLGLDVTTGRAEEVRVAEEAFGIYMDSTKRKRRKKMKKHKLKKRRKLQHAKRLKIGR